MANRGQSRHMTTTTLRVDGMTCGACTSSIESAFTDVPGVASASVSLVMERAVVQHDATLLSAVHVRDMIDDRGFDAQIISSDEPQEQASSGDESDEDDESDTLLASGSHGILASGLSTTTLRVGGMTCGACTSAVEGAFKDVAGIKSFSISLLAERAVIEHDANIVSPARLAETIEDVGFDAEVVDSKSTGPIAGKKAPKRKGTKANLVTTTIAVGGMTCGACTSAVESAFDSVPGLVQFNISLLAERAIIVHDAALLPVSQIIESIEDRGFDATIVSSIDEGIQALSTDALIQLKVYGLPSHERANDLESTLRDIPGIISASVSFATMRASITHSPAKLGLRGVVEAIEKLGYNALVADLEDNNAQLESLAKTKEIQEGFRALKISAAFAVPVFVISMILPMYLPILDFGRIKLSIVPGLWLGDVVCLLLTIPVQFGIGHRFYVSAFKSLRHGSPTMDVLVVLGTSAAFFFSCASMLVSILTEPHSKPSTTFDTSTMLITFILLGRCLENRAKGQTSRALSRLMSLAPPMATIYADPIAAAKAAEEWHAESEQQEKESKVSEKNAVTLSVEERNIPTELIEVSDVVILKPGDKIPADGIVIRGESYVNESMVTGEAMPVNKTRGSALMAGTVNNAGRLDFKVTRTGRDTQLSQIVRLVQEAQTSRAPIQRMADRVAGVFVPIIIALGLVTFFGWLILSHALPHPPQIFLKDSSGGRLMVCVKLCIAVIVFACPCALGLATPTAVMVGTGLGAEQGILVKGGAALETATRITHVVLDKTGTLTMGKMSVSSYNIGGPWNHADKRRLWWTIVGLAEGNSEHPIAKAVYTKAKEALDLKVEDQIAGDAGEFRATVGKGIAATVEPAHQTTRARYSVLVGNALFMRSNGIRMSTSEENVDGVGDVPGTTADSGSTSSSSPSAGVSSIYVAIDGEFAGMICLSDTLKPSARAAVSALQRMNISASLVTGDQAATAYHVANLVGIARENVFAGVLPEGKKKIISDYQAQGHVVAMVGDGINDSPALAAADVGISLASGTDVAVDAADVVLMRPTQLLDIAASLHLSRAIFRRIKLNLLFSCVYNAVGLPIAMGILLPWGITLPPLAAGAAMACSSVTVVVSSLMLRFWRRPEWMRSADDAALPASGVWSSVHATAQRWADYVLRRRKDTRGMYAPIEVALDDFEAV